MPQVALLTITKASSEDNEPISGSGLLLSALLLKSMCDESTDGGVVKVCRFLILVELVWELKVFK